MDSCAPCQRARSELEKLYKFNRIKNARDYFDSHTGSLRQGWKAPLPPQYMAIHQAFRTTPEPELRKMVKGILNVK